MKKKLKVIELFAWVGGFRLGLEGYNNKSAISGYTAEKNSNFEIVWSNQWEPSTKTQHASMVYECKFGKQNHSNEDIASVEISNIPDHDVLVGGFPCQDYSVATTLKNSKGIIGKKGVLWWSIYNILAKKNNKPKYLILENVDRLLISPSKQRGRDFAIILESLNELGYIVEWRVINAADFGMPQRRKRTFILAYHQSTKLYELIQKNIPIEWILSNWTFAQAFPAKISTKSKLKEITLVSDLAYVSENFNKENNSEMFQNAGIMINGKVTTLKLDSCFEWENKTLWDILESWKIADEFYIKDVDFEKWQYLKGAKKEKRVNASGFEYNYSEWWMLFPDATDKPSRTIITWEGWPAASRFKHVVKTDFWLRRLSPVELERLNMFPDNHTFVEGVSDTKRAFLMGNALVIGIVEKIGDSLIKKIEYAK